MKLRAWLPFAKTAAIGASLAPKLPGFPASNSTGNPGPARLAVAVGVGVILLTT